MGLPKIAQKLSFRSVGEWRSLVAHSVWDRRVAGSNPVSPTTFSFPNKLKFNEGSLGSVSMKALWFRIHTFAIEDRDKAADYVIGDKRHNENYRGR